MLRAARHDAAAAAAVMGNGSDALPGGGVVRRPARARLHPRGWGEDAGTSTRSAASLALSDPICSPAAGVSASFAFVRSFFHSVAGHYELRLEGQEAGDRGPSRHADMVQGTRRSSTGAVGAETAGRPDVSPSPQLHNPPSPHYQPPTSSPDPDSTPRTATATPTRNNTGVCSG
jgi:hypothetical protein